MGREVWDRFTIHLTPKHGSWLNQEIEIGLFSRQCLGRRRIPDQTSLRRETRACNGRMNRDKVTISSKFDRRAPRRRFGYKHKSSHAVKEPARFIIADITNPRSSPLELQAKMPDDVAPFVPLIQEGESPFPMFRDLQQKYRGWVLDVLEYDSAENLPAVFEGGCRACAGESPSTSDREGRGNTQTTPGRLQVKQIVTPNLNDRSRADCDFGVPGLSDRQAIATTTNRPVARIKRARNALGRITTVADLCAPGAFGPNLWRLGSEWMVGRPQAPEATDIWY